MHGRGFRSWRKRGNEKCFIGRVQSSSGAAAREADVTAAGGILIKEDQRIAASLVVAKALLSVKLVQPEVATTEILLWQRDFARCVTSTRLAVVATFDS